MKKAVLILMAGIAVAAAAMVSPLSWKSTSLELGALKVGETVDLQFEFTNESGEPITILEAKGSCGCTEVKVAKSEVAPGETSQITAKFTAKSAGAFKKNIQIKTSASEDVTYLYFSGITE